MLSILGLMLISTQASANAGIPMIIIVEPLLWLTFIPIVLIESVIYVKTIQGLSFKKIIIPTVLANVFSTIIGIPVTWLGLFGIEAVLSGGSEFNVIEPFKSILNVTVNAPWMLPDPTLLEAIIAMIVLFIPFFFISVWSERFILAKMLKKIDKETIYKSAFKAHIGSYAFLGLAMLLQILILWK